MYFLSSGHLLLGWTITRLFETTSLCHKAFKCGREIARPISSTHVVSEMLAWTRPAIDNLLGHGSGRHVHTAKLRAVTISGILGDLLAAISLRWFAQQALLQRFNLVAVYDSRTCDLLFARIATLLVFTAFIKHWESGLGVNRLLWLEDEVLCEILAGHSMRLSWGWGEMHNVRLAYYISFVSMVLGNLETRVLLAYFFLNFFLVGV